MLQDTNIGRLILENASTEKTAAKSTESKYAHDASKISDGLNKIAGLPYKEGVYNSVQEMIKIASQCINELSSALASANGRTGELEKAAEVRVLVDDMIRFGAVDENNLQEKIAELMDKDNHQLDIVKEAVKLSQSRDMGNRFFELEKDAGYKSSTNDGMFGSILG